MADAAVDSVAGAGRDTAVRLSVPPDPTMSRVARLAASGLASLAGCTVDEIEDIKIAVSEVLIALVEHGSGARVELQFDVVELPLAAGPGESADAAATGPAFVVHGTAPVDSFDLSHPDLALCRTVLEGVCESCDIGEVDGQASITAVVRRGGVG